MSTIVDRYVAVVGTRLPEKIRRDVEEELRATIADIMESEHGHLDADAAAARAVESLGDPVKLAREYAPRPRYLIGPALYDDYRKLLVILVSIVAPIVLVVGVLAAVLDPQGITAGDVGGAFGSAIQAAVWVCFWVTVVFAILEWNGVRSPRASDRAWTVADLPAEAPARQVKLSEVVVSAAFTLVFISLIVAQHFRSTFSDDRGPIPFFDPQLWNGWLPALIVLLAAGVVVDVLLYLRGRHTLGLTIASTVTDALFGAVAAVTILTQTIVNPAWSEALKAEVPELTSFNVVANKAAWTAVILAIVAWSITEAWLKYRKARSS
ncbi:MAG: hypothetical protein GX630_00315 [Actinobacteria bacterium]|nr:hypothetical protein [Actinomycetota bacterium]